MALEQGDEDGCGDDRHSAVLRGLEILIAGDEILWRRMGRHEIEEYPITLVADWCACGWRYDEVSGGPDGRDECGWIHACSHEGRVEFGAVHDFFELGECRRTHDRD